MSRDLGSRTSDTRRIGLAFALALWASLYKESIVILLLSVSGLEVLRLTIQGNPKERLRHLPVLIYTILYLAIYALWAGHPGDANYAASHQSQRLTVLFKTIESNPEFLLLFLPLLLIRINAFGRNFGRYTFYDSLMIGGLGYAGLFLLLGMWNQYYLYPGMVLALVGTAGILAERPRCMGALSLCSLAFLIVMDSAPAIYAETRFQHDVITHHGRLIDFLKGWAPDHCAEAKPPCVFVMEGVSDHNHSEVLVSLAAFLAWTGAPQSQVLGETFNSDEEISGGSWAHLAHMASKGSYVVVNPYRNGSHLPKTPSLTPLFAIPQEESLSPPPWRLHEWLWRASRNEKDFEKVIETYSRFTGYGLYQKNRDSLPLREGAALTDPQSEVRVTGLPKRLSPGERLSLVVAAKNLGAEAWLPSPGRLDAPAVYLLFRWFGPDGTLIAKGERQSLPEAILPGETAYIPMRIEAPQTSGNSRLEFTAFQEGVQWIPGAFSWDMNLQ
jgi:hypothetical protein